MKNLILALAVVGCGKKAAEPEPMKGAHANVTVEGGKAEVNGTNVEVSAYLKVENQGAATITIQEVDYSVWLGDADCKETKEKAQSLTVASMATEKFGLPATHTWGGEGDFPWKSAKFTGEVKWVDGHGNVHVSTFTGERELEVTKAATGGVSASVQTQ